MTRPSGEQATDGPRAGDPLPPAVAGLLAALAAGDSDAAAASFAHDAVWAPPSDEADEVSPRAVCQGRAIAAALAVDPQLGRRHDVRLCLHEGSDCMIEGEILGEDGAPLRSHGASFQLDRQGSIARALVFRAEPVEDNAGTGRENVSGAAIQAEVDEYFEELGSARFENAAAYFSADALYLHPPYSPGTPRVAFRGEAGIIAGFQHRGPRDWAHVIDASIQRGAYLMFEGHALVDGTAEGPTGSFISSATVDDEGKILRYLAFYAAPMVPRR